MATKMIHRRDLLEKPQGKVGVYRNQYCRPSGSLSSVFFFIRFTRGSRTKLIPIFFLFAQPVCLICFYDNEHTCWCNELGLTSDIAAAWLLYEILLKMHIHSTTF
jgi:hypothetical protein